MGWWPHISFGERPGASRRLQATASSLPVSFRRASDIIRARYDAAQTTTDNAKHWAMADSLSADAANSLAVRKVLRERSRYEFGSNSYAKGCILTMGNCLIGRGPRIQFNSKDKALNASLESDFSEWSRAIKLARKLRKMVRSKIIDGETFGIHSPNPKLDGPVQLNLTPLECDRFTSFAFSEAQNEVDGIFFDIYGNAESYTMLRSHPGSDKSMMEYAADYLPAADVAHWFRDDRAEQHRGIPELAPALPLFAKMRSYTQSVLSAAEAAADFAMVIYSSAPAGVSPAELDPYDLVDLERGMATVLPDGWNMGQVKAEQPVTTYAEFKHEVLGEVFRCLLLPYNVGAGNSSSYNYASGRLDFQAFSSAIDVERDDLCTEVLRPLVKKFVQEWALSEGHRIDTSRLSYSIMWDGFAHVDPAKEASAQSTRLASGTTNLAAEYAKDGKDWEQEQRQAVREKLTQLKIIKETAAELGIDFEEAKALFVQPGTQQAAPPQQSPQQPQQEPDQDEPE